MCLSFGWLFWPSHPVITMMLTTMTTSLMEWTNLHWRLVNSLLASTTLYRASLPPFCAPHGAIIRCLYGSSRTIRATCVEVQAAFAKAVLRQYARARPHPNLPIPAHTCALDCLRVRHHLQLSPSRKHVPPGHGPLAAQHKRRCNFSLSLYLSRSLDVNKWMNEQTNEKDQHGRPTQT